MGRRGVLQRPPPHRGLLIVILLVVLSSTCQHSGAGNVMYDHRSLLIDGVRRVLISGSIHYPRSTPEMWPEIIQKAKDGGLDVVETYVFWNLHEPVRNQYDFEGRKDLVRFVKAVAAGGLYLHLRIGPYVCAEWNYGGFPLWLHFVPGIKFRTDNEPFKAEMRRFTAKIVDMMKKEKLYASQGGPIILSQIENEYGNVDAAYGPAAQRYVNWAASMAVSLNTGVPWVMCNQPDAPDPVINTCNGFYCDQFTPNSNGKPKIWTENWSGWFQSFGGALPTRPVEDLAFAVARFFQRGGTFQNYYMYHGGTNFDRSSGGPFIATSYDYDAPVDEYGHVRQPKWGHLRDLHKVIKNCEAQMIESDPVLVPLGPNKEAHMYNMSSGVACAAFLANVDATEDAYVTFNGRVYHLPAWSVSILPDCQTVVFNTAQINSQTATSVVRSVEPVKQKRLWSYRAEPVGITKRGAFRRTGLLEQINTTADISDYLWYSTSVVVRGDEPYLYSTELQSSLHVNSLGHVLHVFINGKLSGSRAGNAASAKVSLEKNVSLVHGTNKIDFLSATVGLQNYGAFYDLSGAGVTGPVYLAGRNATLDLSSQAWIYQIGLLGEDLRLYDTSANSAEWLSDQSLPVNQPLTWYRMKFEAPAGNDPVAIDFTGMSKGEAWVNGQSIGRYWTTYVAPQDGCIDPCNYRGSFFSNKCLKNCGKPSQQLYHVPRSLLRSGENCLVLFEEVGGDPTKISFATKRTESLCSHVSELHPAPVDSWISLKETGENSSPAVQLECPNPSQVINTIKFASFGTPQGSCGSYSHGQCSSPGALAVLQEECLGARRCRVAVSSQRFGDPCEGVTKSLAVEAACS